jgi:ATP-binding cassette subfamily F protein uup
VVASVKLRAEQADPSGRLVFEAEDVWKAYGDRVVVRELSTRVMRGDRVGLIGPNGAGKTTLLRLLLGDLDPDRGTIRHGTNVQIAYYDQQREQLDPERTVFDTIGEGRDTVTVNGQPRHVNAYLRDFLFPPERARSPVRSLSGGERNRLLLARLFTRPANVLVLDEPTNDLDLETLELLEAQLVEWPGTLLLVSHDRVFLDNVVTSTMVFEAEGRVAEYVGGYADWLRQRAAPNDRRADPRASSSGRHAEPVEASGPSRRKLSYNERRELDRLPARIESLEAEHTRLETDVAGPEFYKEGSDVISRTLARIAEVERELLDAYSRLDDLKTRT